MLGPNRVQVRTHVGPIKGTRENKVCWAQKGYTRGQPMMGPKRVHVRAQFVGPF